MSRNRNVQIKSESDHVSILNVDDDNDDSMDRPDAAGSNNAININRYDGSNNNSRRSNKNDDDDNDNDDDEIVREFPVFMSPEFLKQIQLIQYPLQMNIHPSPPEAA